MQNESLRLSFDLHTVGAAYSRQRSLTVLLCFWPFSSAFRRLSWSRSYSGWCFLQVCSTSGQ
ncbi:MAG: hypothetical protein IPG04_37515 [Polyangiaceae bacterium]|nr:hypothetical protein [Polyangiaceae bacterium]